MADPLVIPILICHSFLPEERSLMRKEQGFTLIELLIILTIIGIIAAITVPNFLKSKAAINEASAIKTLTTIATSQLSYASTQGSEKYAEDLEELHAAGLIDFSVDTETKDGYTFVVSSTSTRNTFTATASPTTPGFTGNRYFFVDESGVLRFSKGAAATSSSNVLSQ